MGTRSTVKFYNEGGYTPILSVYQQYDGYPSGVGRQVFEFLNNKTIVNGFDMDDKMGTHANGIGCLAAQFVAENKTRIGGFYITNSKDVQEYNYVIKFENEAFKITVKDWEGKRIFNGTLAEFGEFVNQD